MIYRAWIESENQSLFIGSESYDQDGLRDVHGKTDLKFFVLETDKQMTLKLGMLHWGLWPYQYCSNDGPWLTFAALQQVLIRFLTLYYGKKGRTVEFSQTRAARLMESLQDSQWSVVCRCWGNGWMCIRLVVRRSWVWCSPRRVGNMLKWKWIFYDHFLISAASIRVIVSFWRQNVRCTG